MSRGNTRAEQSNGWDSCGGKTRMHTLYEVTTGTVLVETSSFDDLIAVAALNASLWLEHFGPTLTESQQTSLDFALS